MDGRHTELVTGIIQSASRYSFVFHLGTLCAFGLEEPHKLKRFTKVRIIQRTGAINFTPICAPTCQPSKHTSGRRPGGSRARFAFTGSYLDTAAFSDLAKLASIFYFLHLSES